MLPLPVVTAKRREDSVIEARLVSSDLEMAAWIASCRLSFVAL